jgi:hypothetical protein
MQILHEPVRSALIFLYERPLHPHKTQSRIGPMGDRISPLAPFRKTKGLRRTGDDV